MSKLQIAVALLRPRWSRQELLSDRAPEVGKVVRGGRKPNHGVGASPL